MNQRNLKRAIVSSAALVTVGLCASAQAQITLSGSLAGKTSFYGNPLATQTLNTQFGDSTVGDGTSGGGSELDGLYANASNGSLYVFLAGNFESNGNHVNLFIADGRSGQSTLNANGGPLNGANGMKFPTGFSATYAIDGNDYAGTFYFDTFDLVANSSNYAGAVTLSGGVGSGSLAGFNAAINNTNAAGVNGSNGAANSAAAAMVTTGLEVQIPLSALGNPTGSLQVLADINGGGDSYLSNQFLPGLPVGTNGNNNLGSPASVDLSSTGINLSGAVVTLPVAQVNGIWQPATGGNWNTSSNWSNGHIPNAPGDAASFSSATNASNIALNGAYTVGSLSFNSAFTYNISAGTGGVLTLGNASGGAVVTVHSGAQIISAPVVVPGITQLIVSSRGSSLTLSGNVSGAGSLVTSDPGSFGASPSNIILSGSNTYTGGTNVSGGNLTLGSATAFPSGTALTLSAVDVPAGVLDINGFPTLVSSITVPTGPQTGPTGATARIINQGTTAGVVNFTYAGNSSNPSTFTGIIADSNASGGSTTSLVIASGSLTLTNANTYAGATNVSGGTLTVTPGANLSAGSSVLPSGTNLIVAGGSKVVFTANPTAVAESVGSLSVSGQVDLGNNAMIVSNASIGSVTSLVASGYHNGGWNGATGILSTTAANDSTHLTAIGTILNNTDGSTPLWGYGSNNGNFLGVATIPANAVLLAYTYYGDTSLKGFVDSTDYTAIDNGFLSHLTGWQNGDFNYDGVVNGSDYTLIDNAFNRQGATLASQVASPTAQVAGATSAVPEPTSLALLGMSAAALLGRRRRHN